MIGAILHDRDGRRGTSPYLSYSRINRYLVCPEQYRLYYVENLRPRIPPASLIFGKILHYALAQHFGAGANAVQVFRDAWNEAKSIGLRYAYRETWDKLWERGNALLERFQSVDVKRIGAVHASEKAFQISITSLDVPLIGVIDLVADIDGKRTVLDFKTSSSAYAEHDVALSDQLTAYQLAEPDAEQSALCVFVKTKEPRIEWWFSTRSGDRLVELLSKAEFIASEISAAHFYKRPGMWCAMCDYLPVCLGDERRIRETLIQET